MIYEDEYGLTDAGFLERIGAIGDEYPLEAPQEAAEHENA